MTVARGCDDSLKGKELEAHAKENTWSLVLAND